MPDLPRSRATRGAAVAKLAAGQAVRNSATKAANLTRTDEQARLALERRHIQAAEQIVTVLGSMKGAAMKLGQMLSVLDLGLLPEEERPRFQAKLAALRDAAPHVEFKAMRAVVEQEVGPLKKTFASFETTPVAAASIGQVFKAQLKDGRAVAVKVQYPGVAAAVRADLKNLALFVRFLRPLAPGLDFEALTDEIRTRVIEELDYRLEAANQASAAALYQGHPFIVVPQIISALCTERVLVMEYVEGVKTEVVEASDQATRDRVGEILYRFYCGSMYRAGQFSGDPHPGNYLLMDDGRVAFLDFGMYKRMDPASVEFELDCQRAAAAGDEEELHRLMAGAGILPEPERLAPSVLLGYVLDAIGWYLRDEPVTITRAMATDAFIASADPRSIHYDKMRFQSLPPEHLIARRTEIFVLALLGQLGASGNWHAVAREWLVDAEPRTDLGHLEAAHWAARSPTRQMS